MSLVSTFRVGRLTCHTLDGGLQRLDGGAMFGVVPKPLWSRLIDADDRNRVPVALRCTRFFSESFLAQKDWRSSQTACQSFSDSFAL